MSISPRRYAAGPTHLRGRGPRAWSILLHEVKVRFGAAMIVLMALGYAVLLITLIVDVELFSGPSIVLANFADPYRSVVWPLLVLLVVTAAGAPSIAADLGNRSITLYLSRPIHLVDYLLAKCGSIAVWVALLAIGPEIVGTILLEALGVIGAPLALEVGVVAVGLGLVTVIFFVGLSAFLSSLTSKTLHAGVAIFGLTLSLEIASSAISGVTANPQVAYLSPFTNLQSVMLAVFDTGSTTSTIPWVSAVGLVAVGILLATLAWMRLRRVEVIGE
ncbi:MAG: ABC transporter permease subunit [Thermoplasmata archaeon]